MERAPFSPEQPTASPEKPETTTPETILQAADSVNRDETASLEKKYLDSRV